MMTNSRGQGRPVLADVTNKPGKRTFCSVSGDLVNSGGGKEGNPNLAKVLRAGVESLVTEKCKENPNKKYKPTCGRPVSSLDPNSLCGNVISVASHPSCTSKELSDTNLADDISRSNAVSVAFMPRISDPCNVRATEISLVHEPLSVDDRDENYKNTDFGNFSSSQCASVGSSVLPSCCGTQSFEIERCTGLKGDHSSTLGEAVSSLKSCSCSFCLKAAYIWSDLHYQDIKGRISAVNKSQKEAITLVQRNVRNKEPQSYVLGSSSKSSNLESDLTSQWKSLFLRMEDMFGREITQLKDNFLELKDMREKCKTNLKLINAKPSEE